MISGFGLLIRKTMEHQSTRFIFHEYENVLRRLKFNFEEQEISSVLKVIKHLGIKTIRTPSKDFFQDTSDIVFYEIALTHQLENAYLVTGNLKHFPQKTFIVSQKDMLLLLDKEHLTNI